MSFYSSELMKKYADICGEDWAEYAMLEGRKSEKGFMEFLTTVKQKSAAKARGEIEQAIHWRILDDPANKLNDFTSDKDRARRGLATGPTVSLIQKAVVLPCDSCLRSSSYGWQA